MAGDGLAAADLAQRFEHGVLGYAEGSKGFAFGAVGQTEQDVFSGGVFVAHALGIALSCVQHVCSLARKPRLAAGTAIDFWAARKFFAHFFF